MQHRIIVHSSTFGRDFVFLHRADRNASEPDKRTSALFLDHRGPRGGTICEQVTFRGGPVYVTEADAPEMCRRIVRAWEHDGVQ